ncbi:MAG: hypothetical protein O2794_03935 [bacterium]|nr:hypothetical protein [bacterium]
MAHNKLFYMTRQHEDRIIRFGIIIFWFFYWLLNVVDKFIGEKTFLWVGKDRFAQFVDYFSSIGLENIIFAQTTLVVSTVLELLAFVFAGFALKFFLEGDRRQARGAIFWSILTGLITFSFFAIGDQIFGDRVELLEHTTYWIALVISWFVYTKTEE